MLNWNGTYFESSTTLYMQFRAPDDGRKNRPKHVERLIEKIN